MGQKRRTAKSAFCRRAAAAADIGRKRRTAKSARPLQIRVFCRRAAAGAGMGRKRRRKSARPPQSGDCGREHETSSAATTVDHLSSLPDEVLLSIVSRLPVQEVVRMGILSRRWRRLPSFLPVIDSLDLDYSSPAAEEQGTDRFEDFNRDMSAYWGLIRSCRFLPFRTVEEWVFDQWAQSIAGKGVQQLEVYGRSLNERFDAYPVLHHCKSLTELELAICSLTGVTVAGPLRLRCTGLRELRLRYVKVSDNVFHDLTSRCFLHLEKLEMYGCTGLRSLRINAAPCLRRLQWDEGNICMNEAGYHHVVDIDTPNLEYLSVQITVFPMRYRQFTIRAPNLTSLVMSVSMVSGERLSQQRRVVGEALRSLINNATKLHSLELRGAPLECLSLDLASDGFHPSFQSLTRLEIDVSLQDNQQASCLAVLLQCCSRLQVLELSMIKHDSVNCVSCHPVLLFRDHQKMLEQMGCLSCHLQQVTMTGLTGGIYDMKLACFFLVEARVLKKLTLKFRRGYTEALGIIAKHLPNLRRGSSEANLEVGLSY